MPVKEKRSLGEWQHMQANIAATSKEILYQLKPQRKRKIESWIGYSNILESIQRNYRPQDWSLTEQYKKD